MIVTLRRGFDPMLAFPSSVAAADDVYNLVLQTKGIMGGLTDFSVSVWSSKIFPLWFSHSINLWCC